MRPGGFASKGHVPARAAKQVGAAAAADFCSVSASQPKQREKLKREKERGGSASLLTAKYSPLSKYGPCPFHHPDNISSLKFRCCGTQLFGYIRARRKMILRIFSLPYRSAAAIETANILRDLIPVYFTATFHWREKELCPYLLCHCVLYIETI